MVSYSIHELKKHLDKGKEIYGFIENKIHISPLGILTIYRSEGHILVKDGDQVEISVYEYAVESLLHNEDSFRLVQTEYLTSYKKGFVNSLEISKLTSFATAKNYPILLIIQWNRLIFFRWKKPLFR
jgi:hypothetical protein